MNDHDPNKRSLRSRLIELALWTLLSIAVAVALVMLSNRILPANF